MIKLVKLISGEELIADISTEEGLTKLKNPVRLMVTHEGVGMAPFCPLSDAKEVTVLNDHIIYTIDVDQEVRNGYNQQFGTGIVTATANTLGILDANS